MIDRGLQSTMNSADVLTALSRAEIERKGRWKSFRLAVSMLILIAAVMVPPVLVFHGVLPSLAPVPDAVPARIALTLALGLTLATFLLAWRSGELIRSSRAPRSLLALGNVGVWGTGLGGLAVAIQLVLQWLRFGVGSEPATLTDPALFAVPAMITGFSLGLVVLLAVVTSPGFWWKYTSGGCEPRRSHRLMGPMLRSWLRRKLSSDQIDRWKSVLRQENAAEIPPSVDGTIICCSGGGIRSAAFCLGGLQELQSQGHYAKARSVVGVSGGGYVAAAMHIVRWRQGDPASNWAPLSPPPFAPDSQEFGWLRRHTRYLFDSPRVATLAGLSILFGMSINLFWCAACLGALAWWLGWILNASGGIIGWNSAEPGSHFSGAWSFLGWIWIVPLAGLGLFVIERFVSRIHILSVAVREWTRSAAVILVWCGLALSALLLGLPWLMAAIKRNATCDGGVWSQLAIAVGLGPGCQPAGNVQTSTAASLVTIIVAVLAVVRTGLAKVPGEGQGAGSAWLKRITAALKVVLLPWLALLIILAVALILLMNWVSRFLSRPEDLANWWIVVIFVGVAVVLQFLTDANWTSLHHFYRERLSYAFISQRTNGNAQPVQYKTPMCFSESKPRDGCGPTLVACAVANVTDVEFVPSDRRCTPFVFDHDRIGLTDPVFPLDVRQMPSTTYEFAADWQYRDATIPAAMAMSGAAFSPLVGREQRRVAPFRLIMALANARLGVWLPNPLWADEVSQVRRMIKLRHPNARRAWDELDEEDRTFLTCSVLSQSEAEWIQDAERNGPFDANWKKQSPWTRRTSEWVRWFFNQPGAYRLFKEGVGSTSVMDRRLYITDGGHYDNLGLVEALRRRPQTVIVLDASNDPLDSFRTLGEAIATARIDLNCEVQVETTKMTSNQDGVAEAAWATGRATFADGKTTTVHVVKALRFSTLSLDTEVYRKRNPDFPRTSTGNQFYGEFDFEAYRQLGAQATRGLLRSLTGRRGIRSPSRTRKGPLETQNADQGGRNGFGPGGQGHPDGQPPADPVEVGARGEGDSL